MPREPLLTLTDAGLACPAGGFHIDPWRPVARAVITHAHADHARPGHGAYLATPGTAAVLRQRLGALRIETLGYGRPLGVGGVTLSLHPAGHLPGSAQVRIERAGEVWVVSGDYKTEADGLSEPFEPIACHGFVSECTFGLPVFRWRPQAELLAEIRAWWEGCLAQGRRPVLGAYALGKAQRLIAGLAGTGPGPVLTHGAVEAATEALRGAGYPLPATRRLASAAELAAHPRALILAPPSALAGPWLGRLGEVSTAFASGWMALRGLRRRRGADRGFALSDHADWPGLNAAIAATGAERVFLTHGYSAAFARWLAERGIAAEVLETRFAGEGGEEADPGADGRADPEAGGAAGQDPEAGVGTGSGPAGGAEGGADPGAGAPAGIRQEAPAGGGPGPRAADGSAG